MEVARPSEAVTRVRLSDHVIVGYGGELDISQATRALAFMNEDHEVEARTLSGWLGFGARGCRGWAAGWWPP